MSIPNVPDGPYFVTFDDAEDCPDHKHSGLAKVDTGRSDDWPIARLCEWPTAQAISALPDLLKALKDICNFWAYGMSQPDGAIPTPEDERRAEELGRQASAAIAKAEGRQP